jgi:MFS family permease
LVEEGIYSHLSASQQKAKFTQIFTAGFFTLIGARVAMGWVLDKYGPRCCSSIGLFFVAIGAILFAYSDDSGFDAFAAGMALMGLGGSGIHIANFSISNLFPVIKRSIIASYSAIFGASAILFPMFRLLYDNTTVGRTGIIVSWAMLLLLMLVYSLLTMPDESLPLGGIARWLY